VSANAVAVTLPVADDGAAAAGGTGVTQRSPTVAAPVAVAAAADVEMQVANPMLAASSSVSSQG
jgi:hypothetical protein